MLRLQKHANPQFLCCEQVQLHQAPLSIVQDHVGMQVLVRIAYAGVNGGCETFRVRGTEYTP